MKKVKQLLVWLIIISSTLWAFFFYKEVDPYPGKKVITFAIWGGVAEEKAWDEIIKGFEKKYPDIKVKMTMVPLKYDEKMLTLLAAKIAPDIFTSSAADMIPRNVLLPIDDYLKNDKDIDTSDLFPGMWELGNIKGHHYDILTSVGPIALFYNVKHFKEAGLKTPNEYAAEGNWNYETFVECCKKLVKRDKDGNVTRWAYRIYADYITFTYITINGGKFFRDSLYNLNFKDPKVYEGLQKFADLALKYEVSPPIIAEEQAGVVSSWKEFQRGNVSMMHSGPWMIGRLKGMSDTYDVAPPPIEEGGRTNIGYGGINAIWKGSKHPYEAYLWLKYLASKEGRIIWSKLGFDLPAYKSLWEHKESWADLQALPEHFEVFYDLSQSVLKPPISHNPLLTKKANYYFLKEVWEMIRTGKKSAKDALSEAEPIIQKYIDEKLK
jgi:multiple sugar transport system substrate-binding protein